MEGLRLRLTDQRDDAVRRRVLEGLLAYSRPVLGPSDFRHLDVLAEDKAGGLVGGLIGETGRGLLHVDLLWVAEAWRGRGLGSRLLLAAEREAEARGCAAAWLDTFDFQARPFYERHGYHVFGTLEGAVNGRRRFFMTRRLGGRPPPAGGAGAGEGGLSPGS